jgi:hypothetical protein
MKKTLNLVTHLIITFFLVSCSGRGGSPEAVSKAYLEAINSNDFDKARDYVTEESKGMIKIWEEANFKGSEKDVVNDLKCEIVGDTTALCTFSNVKEEMRTLDLKKIGGKWLVHLSKENPSGGASFNESSSPSGPSFCQCNDNYGDLSASDQNKCNKMIDKMTQAEIARKMQNCKNK